MRIIFVLCCAALLCSHASASEWKVSPFNLDMEKPIPFSTPFGHSWLNMQARHARQNSDDWGQWLKQIAHLKTLPPKNRIAQLNKLANASLKKVEDIETYGMYDHWATPGEVIVEGGDCEDFAIFKFYSALEIGFAPEQLRVVILAIEEKGKREILHSVLAIRIQEETFYLDDTVVRPVAVRECAQWHCAPDRSFNFLGEWEHKKHAPASAR